MDNDSIFSKENCNSENLFKEENKNSENLCLEENTNAENLKLELISSLEIDNLPVINNKSLPKMGKLKIFIFFLCCNIYMILIASVPIFLKE